MNELTLAAAAKIKTPPVFSRLETIIAACLLPLGYLYVKLILTADGLGLGVTLFTLLFMGVVLYWQRGQALPHTRDSQIYLGLIMLTAVYFSLYDNSELEGLALLLLHLLVGYYVATISGMRLQARLSSYLPFDLLDSLLARPFANFSNGPRALFSGAKNAHTLRGALLLLLGLVLAIPACVIVSLMLQEADAAFATLWQRLTGTFLTERLIENLFQFFISLPVACYLFGLLYGAKEPPRELEKADALAQRARFVPGLLAIGAVTPILLIYVIFFCSQTAYFLSAFSGLLPEGYIYSEYARRGFFELCRVSSLNFFIILALRLFCKQEGGAGRVCRAYIAALSLSSIALIAISLAKMLLYIQIYGLTPLRVYTSWFMLMLALIFIFIIVTIYRPAFNVVKCSSILAVTMFLLLAFSNPDALIARYNVNAYQTGRLPELDVALLGDLGGAGIPYLLEIANSDSDKAAEARWELSARAYSLEHGDWRSLNRAEWVGDYLLLEGTW